MATPQIRKSTPVLIVDAIEPSLPFWQERLGFVRPAEVRWRPPRLRHSRQWRGQIMYQTAALLQKIPRAYCCHNGDKTFPVRRG
jgi:hypothetical protein